MTAAFNETSTTDQVLEGVDLSGKRAVVTGASAGLGVETVRALASRGAAIVAAVRDQDKAKRALSEAGVGPGVTLIELDLSSLASARKAADAIVSAGAPIDLIINNAGIMACPQGVTADGFETQLGTNHLGHFVFANRIAPLLRAGGRVVVLSSSAHRICDVDLDDPAFAKTDYEPWQAYGRSKTANALYAVGLDKRLRGRDVRVAAVHPGVIQTELMRHLTPELEARIKASGVTYKTVPQGAATSIWAGVRAPADTVGGKFCEDCHVAHVNDDPLTRGGVRSYALDEARADALWALSERMTGERFAF
ncbi:MAG: SDR family NAD(P)-dependent oxidoreductase [Hyphomonadaceae bacterium]